jgi:hypothetical protein
MDVNTGKLDLHKLNSELAQSNLSLTDLSSKLIHAGTTG